uniref:Uncharacterized protein n=1 Tax=Strongyloides papillosus TaxID=174720 RepID=A0A0N5BUW9_STREA
MIAFKNLLIFLIIFFYQTTEGKQLSEQYHLKFIGNITCDSPKGPLLFVGISKKEPGSTSENHPAQRIHAEYGKQFILQENFNETEKDNLYLDVRHLCLRNEESYSGKHCTIKLTSVKISFNDASYYGKKEGERELVEVKKDFNLSTLDKNFDSKCIESKIY